MSFPLRPWQAVDLVKHINDPKRAIFAEPRLGKTRLAVEYLKAWGTPPCLITAPKTVCPYWVEEGAAQGITILNGYEGTVKDTVALLRAFPTSTVVVNDDRLALILQAYPSYAPRALIADESHRFKSPSSKRGRAFRRLAQKATYVRTLTGTPTPNNYGNLWGQMSGLNQDDWFSSFTKFKQRYLITDQLFHSKILGYNNLPELETKLKKWATIVKRSEVFGPDTWQFVERRITLPPAVMALYRKLAKEWIAEINGQTINGTHCLTRFLRFQQITSGFVGTDVGTESVHTAKVDAVIEDLEEIVESGEKAVIFCKFTWEVETYKLEIEKRLKCKVVTIQGSTSLQDRQAAIQEVNQASIPVVCIAQIQAGGTGISLAGATHALFVSETFSYAEQQQAQDRIYSPGKSKCVTFYRVPNTIDSYIARTLELKKSVNESVQNQRLEEILFGGDR
jgi:SWI/SNF-related matrix-associated actin-dependent regulator 1 of chromatin subfamily A